MDIDTAYTYTTTYLPPSERILARNLYCQVEPDANSTSRIARQIAPSLDLGESITKLQEAVKGKTFISTFIRLYCDTLFIHPDYTISLGDDTPFVLEVFARKLDFAPASVLKLRLPKRSEVLLYVPGLPQDLPIQCNTQQDQGFVTETSTLTAIGSYGSCLKNKDGHLVEQPLTPPEGALKNLNYLNLVQNDGTIKDPRLLNDFFPRLLGMQMLVAQAHIHRNRKLASDLLSFVCLSTQSPKSIELNYKASSLLNGIMSADDVGYVSSLNVYACDQILKSRLVAALAFETAFRDFTVQADNQSTNAMSAINVLAKSRDALTCYEFQKGLSQKEFLNAYKAHDEAERRYEVIQNTVTSKKDKFKQAVDDYIKQKKQDATNDIVLACLDVTAAVGMAVLTGGATAGSVISTGKKALDTAKEMWETFKKLADILKQLVEIINKIGDLVHKIKNVLAQCDKIKHMLETQKGSLDTLSPRDGSVDVFNATADWSEFEILVNRIETEMAPHTIKDKGEYFDAMRIMVIYGKTVINARANLMQKGDQVATVLLQQKLEQTNTDRLEITAQNVQKSEELVKVLRRAMFDRLLAIRSVVFLDFWSYENAYQYHTLLNESLIVLSPLKPIVDFLEDSANLQAAVLSYGSRILIQKRTFHLLTLGDHESPESLAQELMSTGLTSLNLLPTEAMWKNFYRIRLSRVRCYLEGIKLKSKLTPSLSTSPSYLRLTLSTSGSFFDNDFKLLDYSSQSLYSPCRAFTADARTLSFEYDPSSPARTINCDGNYGLERDYTMHTPMTVWQIRILSNVEYGTLKLDDLDFSEFTGFKMEFLCEFTSPVTDGNESIESAMARVELI